MVMDLSSLPEETRAGLEEILGNEDAPDDEAPVSGDEGPTDDEEGDEGDEPRPAARGRRSRRGRGNQQSPADPIAQLNGRIGELIRSQRLMQEQIVNLHGRLNQPAATQQSDPVAEALDELDMTDPTVAKLAQLIRGQNQELTTVKRALQAQGMSAAEQAERQRWYDHLAEDWATPLGVSFDQVQPLLARIPTTDLAKEGAKIITGLAGKRPGPGGGRKVDPQVAAAVKDILIQHGLYNDVRSGLFEDNNAETEDRLAERLNSGELDFDEYEKQVKALNRRRR